MKFLILIALCATVAYASSWNWNRGDDHGRNNGWNIRGHDNNRGYQVVLIQREDNHRQLDYNRYDRQSNGHRVNEGGWALGKLSAGAGAGQGSGWDTGRHW